MRRKVGDAFIAELTGLTPTVFQPAITTLRESAQRVRCVGALDFIDATVAEVLEIMVIVSACAGDVEIDGEPILDRVILRTVETFEQSISLWRQNLLPMDSVIYSCAHVMFSELLAIQRLEILVGTEDGTRLWAFPADRWLVKYKGHYSVEVRQDTFGVIPLEASDLMHLFLSRTLKRAAGMDGDSGRAAQ